MVVEGGNLGFTALGRIEYSAKGLMNNDAVDNSAGVDMSDHEVNLKILLKEMQRLGLVSSEKERNEIMQSLGFEVAELCLQDNRHQAYRLAVDSYHSAKMTSFFVLEVEFLEKNERMNRVHNAIPKNEWFFDLAKKGVGIYRPILAVLTAHLKNNVYQEILHSPIPDFSEMESNFVDYFPNALQEKFNLAQIPHPLKREIIATVLTNRFVNQNGFAFLSQVASAIPAPRVDILFCYFLIEFIFPERDLKTRILHSAPTGVYEQAMDLVLQVEFLTRARVIWFLSNLSSQERDFSLVADYKNLLEEYAKESFDVNSSLDRKTFDRKIQDIVGLGFSKNLAEEYVRFLSVDNPLDTCRLKKMTGLGFQEVQLVIYKVEEEFYFEPMLHKLYQLQGEDPWQRAYIGILSFQLNQVRMKYLSYFGAYLKREKTFDLLPAHLAEKNKFLSGYKTDWALFEKNNKDWLSGISLFLAQLDKAL